MSAIWYDAEQNVLGIQLKNKGYWKSVEVSKNVVVDLSHDGKIIGVDILGAKRSFKKDTPLIISKASSKSRL